MDSRKLSSMDCRPASPDLRARCSTGPGSMPEPTAVPVATAVPMVKRICTVDSAERSARSSFSNKASRCGVLGAEMSPLMTLSASVSLKEANPTSATTIRLSDTGKRMVVADVGLASLSDTDADKVMSGDISAPSTPQRDALFEKLERAERSAESTVQLLLTMGTAVATGTAVGSGMDPGPVEQRARKSGEASRQTLEENMREPTRRYLAYGYRDLSDSDLKRMLSFLQSNAGKQYISAYLASLGAGFSAMGRRCGEQLGESLRELAMAQLATESAEQAQP